MIRTIETRNTRTNTDTVTHNEQIMWRCHRRGANPNSVYSNSFLPPPPRQTTNTGFAAVPYRRDEGILENSSNNTTPQTYPQPPPFLLPLPVQYHQQNLDSFVPRPILSTDRYRRVVIIPKDAVHNHDEDDTNERAALKA